MTRSFTFGPEPSVEAVAAAAEKLLAPNALCFVRGHVTNIGFAASISFNSVVYSDASGTLEVALRDATIKIEAPEDAEWSPDLLERVRGNSKSVQIKQTMSAKQAAVRSVETQASLRAEAQSRILGIMSTKVGGDLALKGTTSASDEDAVSQEMQYTIVANNIEAQRPGPREFLLRYRATDNSDLVAFNPELSRLPLLELPFPIDATAASVTISLHTHLIESDSEIGHCLRIRHATGVWSALSESVARRVVTELMIEKILKPLHRTTRLWPPDHQ